MFELSILQNTNESANVTLSSTLLAPLPQASFPFAPIGVIAGRPPPLLPPQLGPYRLGQPPPGVASVVPIPYLQMSVPSRLIPTPTTGLQQLTMPAMISYARPGPIGSMTPMVASPTMQAGPTHSFSNVSATYPCNVGQPTCMPMFFPSETSFQLSTSPCSSNANLTTSQVSSHFIVI